MKYPIAIEYGDEKTATGIVIPDIPGAVGAGDSWQKALDSAAGAAGIVLDDLAERGVALPYPSDAHEYRDHPDFTGWAWGTIEIDLAVHQRGAEGETPGYLVQDARVAKNAFEAVPSDHVPMTDFAPAWVRIDNERLLVGTAEGRWVSCPLWWFPRLNKAGAHDREMVDLSASGVHWPGPDEDISVDGLLRGYGDISVQSGLRELFLSRPAPKPVACISMAQEQAQAMSDERCLGVCRGAMSDR